MINIDKSFAKLLELEKGFWMLKQNNVSSEKKTFNHQVDKEYIQLHFALEDDSKLIYHGGMYAIDVKKNNALFLYNPNEELPIHSEINAKAKFLTLLISIEKFHALFIQEAGVIQFLDSENRSKKYYSNKVLSPREIVVLNEIFNFNLSPALELLFSKGKVYELLSIFFSKTENKENCPFLQDENNVNKIIQAKKIIINEMDNPPSLNELAQTIDLPLARLKEGFKQIYGTTVFNFLLDYKMDIARNMIESRKHNVSEISDHLGYSNPSHFIVAFKKKYGTTPKQFTQSL